MKVILNVSTSFEGKPLKTNDEIDIPLNVAQRWITKGLAHPVIEEVKPVEKVIEKPEENKKVFDNEFYGLNKEIKKADVIKKAKKDKKKAK
jgi:hypothetical protein